MADDPNAVPACLGCLHPVQRHDAWGCGIPNCPCTASRESFGPGPTTMGAPAVLTRDEFAARALSAFAIPLGEKLGVPFPVLPERDDAEARAAFAGWINRLASAVQAATERVAGAEDVRRAWLVPGPSKRTHMAAQRRLQRDWPTLAKAIARLVGGYE